MPEMPLSYQSIVKVMEEVGCVGKNQRNLQQGFMFRGIDAVMNAIYPALVKNKVFIVPEVLEQEREERKTKSGTNMIYSVCKIRYTFFAVDGSNISAIVVGEGMDTGDKATNKAMATAFKYACFQVFCIPTEEMKEQDPDFKTPEPSVKKKPLPDTKSTESNVKKPLPDTKQSEKKEPKEPASTPNALEAQKPNQISRNEIGTLEQMLKNKGIQPQTIHVLYRVNSLEELSEKKYQNIMEHLKEIKEQQDMHYQYT